MRTSVFHRLYFLLAATTVVNGQSKIVLTNDDGWAVANVRAQNTALKNAGFNVVLSSPAENESGTGSSDAPPTVLGSDGCEFQSCPAGAPATGSDPDDARLNYVNSFPVTSVRFGIQTAAPPFFGGTEPDFVVSGPNVGKNLGSVVLESGTVGAACEAAKEGIPSVAFSGAGGSHVSYTTLSTPSASTTTAEVFAALGTTFTQALLATPFNSSSPILPPNITLNVNYAAAKGDCTDADAFSFVLTRIHTATSTTPADVTTCGSDRLPTERSVVSLSGCFASVSVMNATTKGDVDSDTQEFVLNKLRSFLSCT
ncbi:acid phosphatase [Phellopilus nigrolimitatus]|nr:acid phosphatase [Phellopilus nigrolimitatus]